MLSAIEEMSDIYDAFAPHVDTSKIAGLGDNVCVKPSNSITSPSKKVHYKTFLEVEQTLQQGKKRDVKLIIRDNNWPFNSAIRSQLWPVLCAQHQVGKSMLDGFYWDMVNQVIIFIGPKTFFLTFSPKFRYSAPQNFQKSQLCCHHSSIRRIVSRIS